MVQPWQIALIQLMKESLDRQSIGLRIHATRLELRPNSGGLGLVLKFLLRKNEVAGDPCCSQVDDIFVMCSNRHFPAGFSESDLFDNCACRERAVICTAVRVKMEEEIFGGHRNAAAAANLTREIFEQMNRRMIRTIVLGEGDHTDPPDFQKAIIQHLEFEQGMAPTLFPRPPDIPLAEQLDNIWQLQRRFH
jgi:hypothetical protein